MKLTMQGRLDPCFLLSYAVEAEAVKNLLPGGLNLTTYRGVAFLNIVISRILAMRPLGVPAVLGLTYWHVAYRLHASAELASGQTIEGLYFLRSDVDRGLPVVPGNILTDFRFHKATIRTSLDGSLKGVEITNTAGGIAGAEAVIETQPEGQDELSPPFDMIEAREKILKYAPFGLSMDRSGHRLKVAEVKRDERQWDEQPILVQTAKWEYLHRTIPGETRLVRATQAMPVDYRWHIGRLECI
jgi:hypothetical protein